MGFTTSFGAASTSRNSFIPTTLSTPIRSHTFHQHESISATKLFAYTELTASGAAIMEQEQIIQTFEPQVNTPALVSFLVIAVVFSLLQLRINAVRDAATRREEALLNLRLIKAAQLSSTGDNDLSPTEEEVRSAVQAYESTLNEELDLRTIIPGVRIVAPNDPKRREEDVAAAKQFLGLNLNEDDELDDVSVSGSKNESSESEMDGNKNSRDEKNKLLMASRRRFDGNSEEKGMKSMKRGNMDDDNNEGISFGAKAVLFTVALSQIGLLIVLSFDPMTANDVFTVLGGSPPADVPLSSWSIN